MVTLRGIWPVSTHYRGIIRKLIQNSLETFCKTAFFTFFFLFYFDQLCHTIYCHNQIILTIQVPIYSFYHYFCFSYFNMLLPFLQGFTCHDEQIFHSGDFRANSFHSGIYFFLKNGLTLSKSACLTLSSIHHFTW